MTGFLELGNASHQLRIFDIAPGVCLIETIELGTRRLHPIIKHGWQNGTGEQGQTSYMAMICERREGTRNCACDGGDFPTWTTRIVRPCVKASKRVRPPGNNDDLAANVQMPISRLTALRGAVVHADACHTPPPLAICRRSSCSVRLRFMWHRVERCW